MTVAVPQPPDLDALLDCERAQPERHEDVCGDMRMVVGARIGHSRVVADLALALRRRLAPGGCEVFQESVKVRTETAFLYPDVFITCEPLDPQADLVTAPVLIAEVLRPRRRTLIAAPNGWNTRPSGRFRPIFWWHPTGPRWSFTDATAKAGATPT